MNIVQLPLGIIIQIIFFLSRENLFLRKGYYWASYSDIEMTWRYARLTDNSREEEYFRSMGIIKQGGIHGTTDLISMHRRFLKRRNYSKHTLKNHINIL